VPFMRHVIPGKLVLDRDRGARIYRDWQSGAWIPGFVRMMIGRSIALEGQEGGCVLARMAL